MKLWPCMQRYKKKMPLFCEQSELDLRLWATCVISRIWRTGWKSCVIQNGYWTISVIYWCFHCSFVHFLSVAEDSANIRRTARAHDERPTLNIWSAWMQSVNFDQTEQLQRKNLFMKKVFLLDVELSTVRNCFLLEHFAVDFSAVQTIAFSAQQGLLEQPHKHGSEMAALPNTVCTRLFLRFSARAQIKLSFHNRQGNCSFWINPKVLIATRSVKIEMVPHKSFHQYAMIKIDILPQCDWLLQLYVTIPSNYISSAIVQ